MFKIVILTVLLIFSSTAFAAQDGQRGPTSTGSFQISLVVLPSAQVQHLQDLALDMAQQSQFATKETTATACVYGGSRSGNYFLVAQDPQGHYLGQYQLRDIMRPLQGKNSLPSFKLQTQDNPHTVEYHLSAKDYNDPTFRTMIPSHPLYLNGAKRLPCLDKTNLDIKLSLEKNAQLVPGSQYHDAVNLIIAPQ